MEASPTMAGSVPDTPVRLIGVAEFCRMLGRGKTWVYGEWADPQSRLPKPIRLGSSTRVVLSEAEQYVRDLVAARDARVAA